jgi:hypothetical protein
MPCPFFEPQGVAADANHPGSRLPLIEEYDGNCHAGTERVPVPAEMRFRFCNHGYSRAGCSVYPAGEMRSGRRYTVTGRSDAALDVLCVEERDYAPVHWYETRFHIGEERLTPEIDDACARAQAIAFCRSFLARFTD